MPTVEFAPALTRHVACPPQRVDASTLRAALEAALLAAPGLKSYVLDEQGSVRKHVGSARAKACSSRSATTPAGASASRIFRANRSASFSRTRTTRRPQHPFSVHGEGLPQQDAYHLVYRHALATSSDGRTLAIGSTTGGLWVSEDDGSTWRCLSRDLPPIAVLRLG